VVVLGTNCISSDELAKHLCDRHHLIDLPNLTQPAARESAMTARV
jgi:hypothetical protein